MSKNNNIITTNLTNHILISSPTLNHPLFGGSVVYITEHLQIGSVGVVINKPISDTLGNMFENFNFDERHPELAKNQLYWGGPNKRYSGFFLKQNTNTPNKPYELTCNRDYLNDILINKTPFFMSIGFACWERMQIEDEIMRNIWIVSTCNIEDMLLIKPEDRYQEAFKMTGFVDMAKFCSNYNAIPHFA